MNKLKSWLRAKFASYKMKDVLLAGVATMMLLVGLATCEYVVGETIVDIGFGFEFDDPKVFGDNPVGIVRLRQEIPYMPGVFIGYEHHSSIPDENDRNVYDGIEIMIEAPFFRRGGCR